MISAFVSWVKENPAAIPKQFLAQVATSQSDEDLQRVLGLSESDSDGAQSTGESHAPNDDSPSISSEDEGPCIGISSSTIFTIFTVILSMCATNKSLWQLVFLSSGKMVASSSLLCLHRVLCIFHSRYVC